MRGRRTSIIGDNLGLLLDAICNTFGAVLLIAILVAIILNTAVRNVLPTDDELERARTLQVLEIETMTLQAEKESLRDIMNLPAPSNSAKPDIEAIALTARIEALRKQIDAKSVILKKKIQAETANSRERREFIIKQNKLSKNLAEAEGTLNAEQKKVTKTASFPILNANLTQKQPIVLLVRYNRLYLPHRMTQNGPVVNLDHMFINKTPTGETEARAKPNAGIDLTISSTDRKVEQLLKRFNPGLYSITVLIGPGSYESYSSVTRILKKNNYHFFPWPLEKNGVWDRGGNQMSVQ